MESHLAALVYAHSAALGFALELGFVLLARLGRSHPIAFRLEEFGQPRALSRIEVQTIIRRQRRKISATMRAAACHG